MQHFVLTPPTTPSPRESRRRAAVLAVGVGFAAVLALITVVAVQANFAGFTLPAPPAGGAGTSTAEPVEPTARPADPGTGLASRGGLPFLPGPQDGHVPEGTVVTLADDDVPTIARLDPALLAAMREAEADAVADGSPSFQITSGWRSEEYQRWLLDDAIQRFGDGETAREYVATPERSKHVTGDAVDIVPLDAQLWLIENGSRYGLCQTYANERWHFELATEPGGVCPEMKPDATT